jgi:hypothetical protein
MSYENPNILTIDTPVGLDAVIESIRADLSSIPWLQKSFGRAWEFTEKQASGSVVRIPKVYQGEAEYLNVLPNDHMVAQSFIMADGAESWSEYERTSMRNAKTRALKIIFWLNLHEIDSNSDYIFTEVLKKDVEKVLKANPWITSIDQYVDEKAEDVFQGYINSGAGTLSTADDNVNQVLMYPYSGFRFNVTVGYYEDC